MVAIVTGKGTGLERSSAWVLGSRGQLGSATMGRDAEGVYVNAANGNLVVTRQDEFLIGLGPDSGIGRAYNSQGNFSDDNGDNWKATPSKNIWASGGVNVAGATVTRRDWDGSETVFNYDVALGKYVTTDGEGAYDTIVYNGEWHWTDGTTGVDEYYSAAEGYHIKYRTDPDGNRLTYTYTAGKLVNVATQNGESTQLVYSGNNLIELNTYAPGLSTRIRYGYDTSNRLSTVTVDLSPGDNSVGDGNSYVTTYTYEGDSKRIASIAQTDGSSISFTYAVVNGEYRIASHTQTVSAGVTRTTRFNYGSGTTTVTDAAGQQTVLSYNANNELTQISSPPDSPGGAQQTINFAYDANGNVTSVTHGPGNVVSFDYDTRGNRIRERDSAGNTVERLFSAKNELLVETRYLVPDPDGAGSGQPATPVTTRYAYDSESHLRYTISAEGYVRWFDYNAPGQQTSAIDFVDNAYNLTGLGALADISYSSMETWRGTVTNLSTARRIDTSYGARGEVASIKSYEKLFASGYFDTSSQKTETLYSYDSAGNLLGRTITNAGGATSTESFAYDGLNRMRVATDFAGVATYTTFLDASGQTVIAHANGLNEVSTYDKAGALIAYARTNGANPAETSTSEYRYDALGRLRMAIDPTGRRNYFLYDSAGRKVADVDPDGSLTEYRYDASDRLVSTTRYAVKLNAGQLLALADFDAGGDPGATGTPSGASLLTNGSFDTSGAYTVTADGRANSTLPGWAKANGEAFEQVLSGHFGVTGTDGGYWLDLDSIAGSGSLLPTGANLLSNAGFDQSGTYVTLPHGRANSSLPGWTKLNAEDFEQVASGQFGVASTNGAYWLDLDSVAVITGYNPIGSNLLSNGSFDVSGAYTATANGRSNTTMPGWTKTNSQTFEQVASGQFGLTATDGAYWLDLDSVPGSGALVPVGSNLVSNGSFEQWSPLYSTPNANGITSPMLTNWTKTNSEQAEGFNSGQFGIAATNGNYWLDLDSFVSEVVPIGQNLLVNGSFEQSASGYEAYSWGRMNHGTLPGWTRTAGVGMEQISSGSFGVTASAGSYWFDLDGYSPMMGAQTNMDINQSVNLTAGQTMLLQFDHANRTTAASGSFEVYWNNVLVATINETGTTMVTKSYQLTAIQGANQLRFKGTGTQNQVGASLDNVRLFNTQAPPGTPSNMDFNQSITGLTAGQTMLLQFDHANRTTAASGSFEVYWNNVLVASINETGTTMVTKSYQVTAVSGSNSLRFKGTGTIDGAGASLDNIRVFAMAPDVGGGNMDISQTVSSLAAGQVVQLKFDHANRTTAASGSFEVYWNNTLIDTITATGTAWQTKTYNLTATAGDNVVRFKGTGTVDANGASLDNVRLYATAPVVSGGNMDISQTVSGLTAGQTLLLEFDHANRTTAASGSFEVWWNGTLVATINETGTTMQSKAFFVTAAAGDNILRFKGTGTADAVGASIDNVRLRATYVDTGGGNMDISQTVGGLAAGQGLQLQFDHANRTTGASGSFEVYWNGALIDTINSTGSTMQTKTYQVAAIAGNNVLRFKGTGTVDAAGASIDNVRLFTTSNVAASGGNLGPKVADVRPVTGQDDIWAWNVFDAAGRVIETIDGTGAATLLAYDGASRLISQTSFANRLAPATVTGFKTTAPSALALPAASAADDRVARNFYDKDGRLSGTLDAEGYLTRIVYDKAGQKIHSIAYAAATGTGYRASGTFDELLNSIAPDNAKDIHNWWMYDARGLMRASVNGEGTVTRLDYTPAGFLSRQRLGQKLDVATLIATPPTFATLAEPAGSEILSETSWTRNAFGQATAQVVTLTGSATTTTSYVYDNMGRVVSETTQSGGLDPRTILRRYDVRGRLTGELGGKARAALGANPTQTQIDDAIAASGITHAYDDADRLISEMDPNGNTTLYYYDADGALAYQVDGLGEVAKYAYDAFGRRTDVTVYAGRIALAGLTGGTITTALTNAVAAIAAAAVDTVSHADFNVDGTLRQAVDPLGYITTYNYNAFREVSSSSTPLDDDGAGGTPRTVLRELTYDRLGLLKQDKTDPAGKNIVTSYGYDAFGRAIALTNANNHVTTSKYDRAGRLIESKQSPDGGTTFFTTSYKYDARGNLVLATDANNAKTHFVYDKANRRIATIDALGAVTTNTYDADGRLVATRAYYTMIGTAGLADEITEAALSLPGTNAADQVTRYAYDKDGRLRFTIDALMHVAESVYDDNGNVLNAIAYDGTIGADGAGTYLASWVEAQVSGFASAAGTRTARFAYDAANRLQYSVDSLGQVSWSRYDSQGRLIKQIEFAAAYNLTGLAATSVVTLASLDSWQTGNAGSGDRVTRAYYDRKGQLNYSIDALGYVTRLKYDKQGNVVRQILYPEPFAATDNTSLANLDANYPIDTPPSGSRVTQFKYDSAGRLEQTIDAEGFVTKLVLDALGQITQSTAAFGLAAASTTGYAYDGVGRVTTETRGLGSTEASVTYFFYDALGRRTASVDGDKYLAVLTYDAVGNLLSDKRYATAITGSFTPASTVAQLEALAGGLTTASSGYDAFGRATSSTDRRGSITSRVFDALDRLVSETEDMEAGTSADNRLTSYTYDNFGGVVKLTDARGVESIVYYDRLGRVTRQDDGENFVTVTAYTRGGQVASVTRYANTVSGTADPAVLRGITPDAARDSVTQFVYDKADRLTKTIDAEGKDEEYKLNAFGERIKVRNKLGSGLVSTDPAYDTYVTTYDYDRRGLLIAETLPITTKNGAGTPIAITTTYGYDGRGNRTQMVEAAGAPEARTTGYTYDKLDRVTATTHDAVTVVNDDLTSSIGAAISETVKYDRRGNAIETVDAAGARTLSWYDNFGRVVAQIVQTEKVAGVDKGVLTTMSRDANGNVETARVYGTLVTLPAAGDPVPSGGADYRQTGYTYYRDDRLKTTTVASLLTGEWNGTAFVKAIDNLVTTLEYDAMGNVVHQEDGRGNDIWSWYDRLGRETARIDQENYLTVWTRDAEGNALVETRYANKVTGSFAPATPAAALPGLLGTGAIDANRITTFTYDRNGRRKTEARAGVAYTAIDPTTGAPTDTSGTATISYTYNGLGQVLTKTEANGDIATNSYDAIGRLTLETGQGFTDYDGASVAPRTAYAYDGLGNVIATRMQFGTTANDANDHVTTYVYSAGGRLAGMTDAVDNERIRTGTLAAGSLTHSYGYDRAGRMVRDSYVRVKSEGTTSVTEAQVTHYDLAGRAIVQTHARLSGATWLFTSELAGNPAYDTVRIRYNAYGEVDGRGITAGPAAAAAYQETFDYDAGGRLWRSNQGDGVLRFHIYDKAGKETLTLVSAGADLSARTVSDYANLVSATGSIQTSGGIDATNAVTTLTVYDRRGQAVQNLEPDRQLTAASANNLITRGRSYNAYGEVLNETDGRGNVTDFAYNTMGRMIEKKSPLVSWTDESGTASTARPTETYGYDLSGRLVSVIDANGNRTRRTLIAGTGHDGADALIAAEFHADGGVARSFYDVFRDVRIDRNELYISGSSTNFDEVMTYDKLGRLTAVQHRGALLTDYYGYDALGQRIQHWNSYLFGDVERTDYDADGRVVSQVEFGGDTTTIGYAWTASLVTTGLGSFGGWTKATTYANGKVLTEQADMFGHVVAKTDLGLRSFSYGYDQGGRLASQATAGETISYGYFNTGRLYTLGNGGGDQSVYGYDANGNTVSEWTQKGYVVVQNATASFDALNRLTNWAEAGNGTLTSGSPPASIAFQYDKNGNIRRQNALYRSLDNQGTANGASFTQDYWFKYDTMNRVTIEKGVLSGGQIGQGTGAGLLHAYDVAGQRASTTSIFDYTYSFLVNENTGQYITKHKYLNNVDSYTYRADGALAEVRNAADTFNEETGVLTVGTPQLKGSYTYDNMQRVLTQIDFLGNGTNTGFQRNVSYNAKGQIATDYTYTKRGSDIFTANTTNSYGTGSGYALGAVTSSVTTNVKNSSTQSTVTTTNSYSWRDSAVQASTGVFTDYVSGTDTNYTTTYYYTPSGKLTSVYIGDGRPRTVTFTTDMAGQVLRRDESDNNASNGDPHEIWYRFSGKQLGYTGNNGSIDTDYVNSINNRTATQGTGNGAFRNNAVTGSSYADFEQGLERINSYGQGGSGGGYTVRAGDTLQSIALQTWGDASLWYKLAEANGIGAGAALTEGQSLTIPSGALSNMHSADTFKPYDPAKALGDLSPTAVKPAKKPGGCGVVGQIIATVIAVVISRLIPIPIVGPVLGNIASQAFLIGIGQQSKFNWKSVGITALSAGLAPPGTGNIVADVINSTVTNIAVQGIAVATGLQKKFDWAGVATAGIGAAVGNVMGRITGASALTRGHLSLGNIAANVAVSGVKAIATAATRSLVSGTSFGDNILAALPDVVGNTAGEILAGGIDISGAVGGRTHRERMARLAEFNTRNKKIRETLKPEDQDNPLFYTLSDKIPDKVKRELWRQYQAGEINFDREAAGLPGHVAEYRDGRIRLDQMALEAASNQEYGEVFASYVMFGDLSEQGHRLDELAWQMMGVTGDSPGDEGSMFAYMRIQALTEGAKASFDYSLGSLGSVRVDPALARRFSEGEVASGGIWAEDRINGAEYYGPGGHYHTAFLLAYNVAVAAKRGEDFAYRFAARFALGAQIPDMYTDYTAVDAYNNLPVRERDNVQSKLHSLLIDSGDQLANMTDERSVGRNRENLGRRIDQAIADGYYERAGLLAHAFGDAYAHTYTSGGHEYPYTSGQGHFQWTRLIDGDLGHHVDFMYERPDLTRSYAWGLAHRIADGLMRGSSAYDRNVVANRGLAAWTEVFNYGAGFTQRQTQNWRTTQTVTDYAQAERAFNARAAERELEYYGTVHGAQNRYWLPWTNRQLERVDKNPIQGAPTGAYSRYRTEADFILGRNRGR